MFKKTFAVAGSLAAAVLAFSPLAQAGPLSSITFSVTGWNALTPAPNNTIGSAYQQANDGRLPLNPEALVPYLKWPTSSRGLSRALVWGLTSPRR